MELISLLLSCPVGSLPSLLATPAISSTLLHLIHSSTPSSPHRVQLQQLVSYLATLKGGLSLPLLAVYCQSYGSTNRELVKQTVDQGLKHDAQLSHQLMEVAPQLMDQALKDTLEAGHTDAVQLHLTLAPHLALAVSHPLLSSSYGQSQTLLRSIHKLYTSLSSSQSSSLAPSLELKLSLLETIHTLLSAAFLDPLLNPRGAGEGPLTREERNAFIDELEAALLPLLPPPMVSSHSVQSLVSASLLQDLQQYYQLSAQVDKASQGLMGEREGRAKELLRRVRESVGRVEGEDGLEVLRRLRLSGGSAAASVQSSQASTGKGKAKAASQDAVRPLTSLPLTLADLSLCHSHLLPPPTSPRHSPSPKSPTSFPTSHPPSSDPVSSTPLSQAATPPPSALSLLSWRIRYLTSSRGRGTVRWCRKWRRRNSRDRRGWLLPRLWSRRPVGGTSSTISSSQGRCVAARRGVLFSSLRSHPR